MATLHVGVQTNRAVLHQQLALDFESADHPGIRDETGLEGSCRAAASGVGHGRGEISGGSPTATDVTPEPSEVGEKPRERHPAVFVLHKHGRPLQPCTPARTHKLRKKGRVVVHRHTSFVIRLKEGASSGNEVDGVELGIDPGSGHTGLAVFSAVEGERRARYAVQIDRDLVDGAACPVGSGAGHVCGTCGVRHPRHLRRASTGGCRVPARQEAREYLLSKSGRACVYCGVAGALVNIDHVRPRSWGGTDRLSNLVLACIPCDQAKAADLWKGSHRDGPRRS